ALITILLTTSGYFITSWLHSKKEEKESNHRDEIIKAIKEILNEENPKFPNKTRSINAIVKGVNKKVSRKKEVKVHYIIEILKLIGATQKTRARDNETMWTLKR
ncbi:hypothetical protein N8017_04780, partial [Crocinitomicaceae bacterium]|nr:hypothetical protein [Crocinitomicaceae bacterium]